MKTKLFSIAFAISISFILLSCSKKSNDPAPAANNVTLKATDGNVYFEGNTTSQSIPAKGKLTTKNLIITGTDFDLQIDTIAGIVGTYNLTPTDMNKYIEITTPSDTWVSYGNSGQIVITAIDRVNQTISGYFKATMQSSTGTTVFSGDFKKVYYTGKSSMTALVNSTAWSAGSPNYTANSTQLNINGNGGFIIPPIYLNLSKVTTTGTYDLTETGDYRAEYYTTSFIQYKATSGQVVITEYDTDKKVIKGTFNFVAPQVAGTGIGTGTGPSTITVTNGQFNIQMP